MPSTLVRDASRDGANEQAERWTTLSTRWYEERVLPLHFVVLLAGIQGLSEALPVSRSGHDAVAWLWLDPGPGAARLEVVLHLATAAALIVAARRRFVAAVGAGLLAITRPTLFRTSASARDAAVLVMAVAASLVSRALVDPFLAPWKSTPVAIGFGLLLTGLLLGTTTLVDGARQEEPSISLALVLGVGHGMAALPGGSDLATALVLMSWMGVKNDHALDVAILLSAGTLVAKVMGAFYSGLVLPELSGVAWLIAMATAFLGTTVALGATRVLLEKRALALVAFWIVPLGLATLAYSRAISEALALGSFPRPN